MTALENLLHAPNAASLNAGLEAAGSNRWVQRCGVDSHEWQPMCGNEVVNWPASFTDARQAVVEAAIEDARYT